MASRLTTVRPAALADLAAVTTIESVSFSDPWSTEAFASSLELPHIRFFVAESREPESSVLGRGPAGRPTLLGYVVALVLADEGEIADLAVAPAARRGGVGGLLLDRVIAESEQLGLRSLFLEVRESNAAARALYASRGFSAVGRRKEYYRSPREDALLLKRDLAPT